MCSIDEVRVSCRSQTHITRPNRFRVLSERPLSLSKTGVSVGGGGRWTSSRSCPKSSSRSPSKNSSSSAPARAPGALSCFFVCFLFLKIGKRDRHLESRRTRARSARRDLVVGPRTRQVSPTLQIQRIFFTAGNYGRAKLVLRQNRHYVESGVSPHGIEIEHFYVGRLRVPRRLVCLGIERWLFRRKKVLWKATRALGNSRSFQIGLERYRRREVRNEARIDTVGGSQVESDDADALRASSASLWESSYSDHSHAASCARASRSRDILRVRSYVVVVGRRARGSFKNESGSALSLSLSRESASHDARLLSLSLSFLSLVCERSLFGLERARKGRAGDSYHWTVL